jgi:hypothetical protein
MVDLSDIAMMYREQKFTMRQIAQIKGCDAMTISRHLKKQGVSARRPNIDWGDLARLYVVEEHSVQEIAKLKGTQPRIVRNHLASIGIDTRSKSQGQLISWQYGRRKERCILHGERSPLWKGERLRTHQGYILCWAPWHPYAHRHGRIYEHRLVVEEQLGRYLMPWEIVHHKNGIKDDNRFENLEVMPSQAEHLPSIMVRRLINKLETELASALARCRQIDCGATSAYMAKL